MRPKVTPISATVARLRKIGVTLGVSQGSGVIRVVDRGRRAVYGLVVSGTIIVETAPIAYRRWAGKSARFAWNRLKLEGCEVQWIPDLTSSAPDASE